jgi:hypothetical protein
MSQATDVFGFRRDGGTGVQHAIADRIERAFEFVFDAPSRHLCIGSEPMPLLLHATASPA